MKSGIRFLIVLVTAPDLKTARRLAKSSVAARLAACVNLVPRIESHYRWQGKMETSAEVLMIFKTSKTRLRSLEKHLLAGHPYDTVEIVAMPIRQGTKRYLDWLAETCI